MDLFVIGCVNLFLGFAFLILIFVRVCSVLNNEKVSKIELIDVVAYTAFVLFLALIGLIMGTAIMICLVWR